MVETPAYDLIIFKVHYGKMTLKIYTKDERVLRIEVILHNAKAYRWGRSLPCFAAIVVRLHSSPVTQLRSTNTTQGLRTGMRSLFNAFGIAA